MFAYACPSCKQRLLAPAERSGSRTICPKCLRPLVIPPPDAEDVTVDLGQSLAEPQPPMAELADLSPAQTPPPYRTPGPFSAPARVAPAPRRSLARTESGMVSLNPTGLAAVDIGAELSAALTMRMKPPPDPPVDLNLSTAGWVILSALAAFAWVGGVVYDPALLPFVALIGLLMVAFGFLWAASLAGQRNWVRGALTLLPPVALWRICLPFGENGYRPLRFVLSGLLALAFYLVGGPAHSGLKQTFAALESIPPPEPEAPRPAGERLVAATSRPDNGLAALVDLAATDYRSAIPLDEHPGVVRELKRLATDPAGRPEIRVQALKTLVKWDAAAARGPVLEMLTGGDASQRRAALKVAAGYPDREMAEAVAARLGSRSEERLAREALEQMAPAAGPVLIKLAAGDDLYLAMTALELLETVGDAACEPALAKLAKASDDSVVRGEAARVLAAVRVRK